MSEFYVSVALCPPSFIIISNGFVPSRKIRKRTGAGEREAASTGIIKRVSRFMLCYGLYGYEFFSRTFLSGKNN
ncbi:MAG: hypothetical protein J6I35_03805 [Ruminobacter sp.]|uniref:hypothetical protein n=1 Tax=Ruminobacter sp. TaxID=2774296 RepID=UPI001B48FA55|nr:hypothetical protein [Ruminobacter sp.]MBP3748662.1 hypothetical protein [Ruminobacter sp.]